MADVSLREITKETAGAIMRLEVAEPQRGFVAPNSVSIAQAHFEPKAWFRAVYAGEEPVGFVMTYEDPDEPEYFLWRFMIDHRHQGNGYGRRALELLVDRLRVLPNAGRLLTSYVPGEGSPGPFYHRMGFADTGEEDGGEVITALPLDTPPHMTS
ncbi:MAG TPA: GNAT family N-acetyltransferase [Acidimicrobiia bacterium]|nr:GNAT family N-acetyltransferase [Acidimicrobiia bacterium]